MRVRSRFLRHAILVALAVVPPLADAAAQGVLEGGAEGQIVGRVVDSETGRGLTGAQIVIDGTVNGVLAGVDGRYLVRRVPPGTVSIRLVMIGYATKTVSGIVVPTRGTAEVNVSRSEEH